MEEEGLYIVGYPPLPSWSEGFRGTVGLLSPHLHSFIFALAYVLGKVFTHTHLDNSGVHNPLLRQAGLVGLPVEFRLRGGRDR